MSNATIYGVKIKDLALSVRALAAEQPYKIAHMCRYWLGDDDGMNPELRKGCCIVGHAFERHGALKLLNWEENTTSIRSLHNSAVGGVLDDDDQRDLHYLSRIQKAQDKHFAWGRAAEIVQDDQVYYKLVGNVCGE